MEGWRRDGGSAVKECWVSDLHPEKAVCWLRFQVFLPLAFILAKHSAINPQIYLQGWDVSVSTQTCIPPLTHADICICRHTISLEVNHKSLHSVHLDTGTQVALTHQCWIVKVSSLAGRSDSASSSSSSCVLAPGAAWVQALRPSLLPPSLGVSRCIINPTSGLRAIRHSLRSLPGVRCLRQPGSGGEVLLEHLILIQWVRSHRPGVSSSF